MCTKGFKVIVELDIHAVTCPGVWLCPNGRVCLKIKILGFSTQTKCIPPVFPLLFHEKFVFEKLTSKCRQLADLHSYFEDETVYAALIQKTGLDFTDEVLLATFKISLIELLYPSTSRQGVLAGVDVDLLMEPSCHFPGIIGPKVEISTKTIVEEVNVKLSERKKAFINPKTLRSKSANDHVEPSEKARVARLRSHPSTCCSVHPVSHPCLAKNYRPPFVVRHKDEEESLSHNFAHLLPTLPCHRWAGKKQHCRLFRELDKNKRDTTKSFVHANTQEDRHHNKPSISSEFCNCIMGSQQNAHCNVCKLYKHYFSKSQTEKIDPACCPARQNIECRKSCNPIVDCISESSVESSLVRNASSEGESHMKRFSDCGTCSGQTHELSRRVRNVTCKIDYPFLKTDSCKGCTQTKSSLVSSKHLKNYDCSDPLHRLCFYKSMERFNHSLHKQAKTQAA